MIELIILDLYDTIMSCEGQLRKGTKEFLDKYVERRFALATDETTREATTLLYRNGVLKRFDGVYGIEHMIYVPGYCGPRKNLTRICAEFGVKSTNAIFVSDGERDRQDALRDRIRFLKVPPFENDEFSFADLTVDKQTF